MKSFKEYILEARNCPKGTKYCNKCQSCVAKPCNEKKGMNEDATANKKQQLQRKQLMLNRQKLQLQMKAVQKKDQSQDMHMKEGKEKKIPKGYHRMPDGSLMKDSEMKEDWQKKSGKNPEGGLNEKGRKSYERENPGSDLKRPSKEVGNSRRASFCARMKGMKKKLTSKKTANDKDSRINKSLRAWNC